MNYKINDEQTLQAADNADEIITFGVICRGQSNDIRKLKTYIQNSQLHLIFKKISMENLYIIDSINYRLLQQLPEK